uniref:Uncharacterized protein n=1 Tax=Manihot esculenta TaxID=3983 RepID=A0A2C9VCQ1_MANES
MYRRLNMGAEEDRMEYLDNDVSNEEEVQVSDWQFCVVEFGHNVFLFQFFHHMDVDRILKGASLNYQQVLLLLHELQSNENPKNVELMKINIGIIGHADRFCCLLYDMPNFPREKFLWDHR